MRVEDIDGYTASPYTTAMTDIRWSSLKRPSSRIARSEVGDLSPKQIQALRSVVEREFR